MNTKLLNDYPRMTFKEALDSIPQDAIVSIGCASGAAWFYFYRTENLNLLSVIMTIKRGLEQKLYSYKCNYAMHKHALKEFSFIQNCSTSGYIRVWKKYLTFPERIKKAEDELQNFNYDELMEAPCVVYRKLDLTYAIVLLKWSVSGSCWYVKEWEEKHGKI